MLSLATRLRPYIGPILVTLLLVFVQSISELYLPTLMSDIVDIGILKGDLTFIFKMGGIMLAVGMVGILCAVSASFFSSRIAMGFGKDLRNEVFTTVTNFSLYEFDSLGTASLITRSTNDITQIQQVVMVMFRMMVSAPLMAVGGVIMAVSKDAKLSLIIVFILPILTLLIVFVAKIGIPIFTSIQKKVDALNVVVRENLHGIRVIRAFARVDYERKRFSTANRDLVETTIKVNRIMAVVMPLMTLILNLTTVAIIWFGRYRIEQGAMEIGDLMAFIQYVSRIMFSFIMVSMMFIMLPRAAASAKRIQEIFSTPAKESPRTVQCPPKADPDTGRIPEREAETRNFSSEFPETPKLSQAKGTITFQEVSFRYPGAEAAAVCSISFTAEPGKTTAIIGSTGAGKSTILQLIPRFYDVSGGAILIDGIDIRDIPKDELRGRIGMAAQQTILFSGSIAENISYGKETASESEILEALANAQASDFIQENPDGIHAQLAQGGKNLSGGQKQRLAIARALIRKPDIYLFDDSLSALDFKTDAQLRKALKRAAGNATVLLVAQRVSSIIHADQIIVLDNGEIAGIGTHRELLEKCSIYQEIAASQLSDSEPVLTELEHEMQEKEEAKHE